MLDVSDLRPTIIPKSDQLNAEQLLGGPMTITVTEVRISGNAEQPVVVHYENDGGRPFKPCKTMRKLLIFAWGENGATWAGKSMTVYNDPNVKFGGSEVGGIRISHLTDIAGDIKLSLTATKGKKVLYEVKRLEAPDARALSAIREAADVEQLKAVFGAAYKATKDATRRASLKQAYDMRMAVLTKPAAEVPTVDELMERIDAADSEEDAQRVLDDARDVLDATDMGVLQSAFDQAWR
jgi:hypothetical protein